ncbi:hypothetical protein ABG067_005239 [Albugo candida]
MPSLGDPAMVKANGRPVGTKNKQKSSTKRNTSGFEHATKRRRHCTLCGKANLNKRFCAKKLNKKMKMRLEEEKMCPEKGNQSTPKPPRILSFCAGEDVTDVQGDENCGFRAVALALFGKEDAWPIKPSTPNRRPPTATATGSPRHNT